MRIYIGQYDAFWSLSLDEWVSLCEEALLTEQYDLSCFRRLKARPRSIALWQDEYGKQYEVLDVSVHYREPLDWSADDFESELQSLRARQT